MQKFELQILWLENSLGLAINQKVGNLTIPLTSYYFWPVSDAWEQIRFELETKLWISKEERIMLLNLVVDNINQWQQKRSELTINTTTNIKQIPNCESGKIFGLP